MANVYFKVLNRNLSRQYSENIISGLQKELSLSTRALNNDLFQVSSNILAKRNNLDIDGLLKYYLINKILKNIPDENFGLKSERQYVRTKNKKYYRDATTNKYYEKNDKNEYVLAENLVKVNEDASYVINEKRTNSGYTYQKVYNAGDLLISMQIFNPEGKVITSKHQAIELAGMRKEFALKHKFSGYSGNSNDILATVLNKFSTPVATGYYMDKYYNLFSWDDRKKCFIRNLNDIHISPLLIDYDFKDNKQVIRKEYTGIR